MFDNANDANRYLARSICYWDSKPIYVSEVNPDLTASGYELPITPNSRVKTWDVNDARFQTKNYKIGYLNRGAVLGAAYVMRRAARITSQGLCGSNLDIREHGRPTLNFGRFNNDILRTQGLADMLTGTYPTLDEARQQLLNDPNLPSVAFDRLFCLRRHERFKNLFFLGYKGRDVAHSDSQIFALPAEFNYLKEICQTKGCIAA